MDLINLGAFAAHLAVAIFLGSLSPGIAPDKSGCRERTSLPRKLGSTGTCSFLVKFPPHKPCQAPLKRNPMKTNQIELKISGTLVMCNPVE